MYDDNKWGGYEHEDQRQVYQGTTPRDPDGYTEPVYQRQDSCQSGNTEQRDDRSYIPKEPDPNMKKPRTTASKIAGIAAAGVLFGCVAGGTMWGIDLATDRFSKEQTSQISQSETVGDTASATTAVADPSTSGVAQPVVYGNDVSAIVDKAMPSVVAINNTTLFQSRGFFGSQTYEIPSSGSGIIVGQNASELFVVTNNHVVQDSTSMQVTFIDGTSVDAVVKGTDFDSDLAIVGIPLDSISSETFSQIKAATLGDSDLLKVGEGVIAIGNALGYGQSVTVGYVSALNREVTADNVTRTLLQTDAAINPGNSGGALLNMKGEVIGINAAKYSSTEVEGMGYAIPITYAQDIMQGLMNKASLAKVEEGEQGYLGIQLQNIDRAMSEAYGMPQGIYVYKIVEGGACANSDLRERDIITKIDDYSVKSGQDLQDMLTYFKAGDRVTLTVQSLENGTYVERKVDVTLGHKPEAVEKS